MTVKGQRSFNSLLSAVREQIDRAVPVHAVVEIDNPPRTRLMEGSDLDEEDYNIWMNQTGYNSVIVPYGQIAFDKQTPWADHSLLIMGYALDERGRITHLLLKNSWGRGFGENGFFTADLDSLKRYLCAVQLLQWH